MALRRAAPLLAVCSGYFLVILDATIVNAALPAIGRDLDAGVEGLQWVVEGYAVALAALLLSAGAVGDRIGSRRAFAAGLLLFGAASAGCGAAPHVAALVAARAVQGAGAALMVPASLALLRAAYPTAEGRARAFGAWGAVAGVAAAGGPLAGGALVALAGWRAVFLVNVPPALMALRATLRHVPAPEPRASQGLDPAGQLLAIAGLAAVAFALVEGGAPGAVAGTLGAIALVTFVAVERRVRAPMLPLGLFRAPGFRAGSAIGLLINLGFYGQLFVVNLAFQRGRGWSALLAGAALLPELAMATIGSAIAGRVVARTGPRAPMVAGLALGAAGLAALAATIDAPYAALVAPLAATGLGMSVTMPAATAATIEAAPAERAGLAAGVLNAARQAGGVVGVALLGALAGGADTPGPALLAAAAAFALGCAVALRLRHA